MANAEQLKIIKKGIKPWNLWRQNNRAIAPDLQGVNLASRNLRRANLAHTNLRTANLSSCCLVGANLSDADLRGANLSESNLREAKAGGALLNGTYLKHAKLGRAELTSCNLDSSDMVETELRDAHLFAAVLYNANLENADLTGAVLDRANLRGARVTGAKFGNSRFGDTAIALVDLSGVYGLETVYHSGPSDVANSTLIRSMGTVPDCFLRGCGFSDWEILAAKLHNPDLTKDIREKLIDKIARVRDESLMVPNPLFIAYSHGDSEFVEVLEEAFDKKHIRCWRDVHKLTAGSMEMQVDRAIRDYSTVLVVLSENSVNSDWVEWEVKRAAELERKQRRSVLCPIALDEAWKNCRWPGPLVEQIKKYNILDFSRWRDLEKFADQFKKLIDGLEAYYYEGTSVSSLGTPIGSTGGASGSSIENKRV